MRKKRLPSYAAAGASSGKQNPAFFAKKA